MKAPAAVAMLDRNVANHGQPVVLRRLVPNGAPIEATVEAFVRGYKPDELVAGILQGDTLITVSPTALAGTPFATALPKAGDKVTFDGRVRNVQMVNPVTIASTLVRLNMQVRGL